MPYFSGSFCEPLEISGIYGNSWDFFKVSGNFLDLRPTVSLEFSKSVQVSCRRFNMSSAFVLKSLVFVCFCSLTNPTLYHCTSVLVAPHILIEWILKKTWSVCILNIHPGVDNKYDWRAVGTASQRGRGGCINISKLKTEKYRNIWTSGRGMKKYLDIWKQWDSATSKAGKTSLAHCGLQRQAP